MSRPILYAGISVADEKTLRLHVTSDPAGKLYVEVLAPEPWAFTFAQVSKTGIDKVAAIKALLAHEKFQSDRFQTFLKAELDKRVPVTKAPKVAKVKTPKATKEVKTKVAADTIKAAIAAPDAKVDALAKVRKVNDLMKATAAPKAPAKVA
jgi:hypothetical protein